MGSVNWNGAFSPTFQKSIGTVRFVSLADMGDKDWLILEYPNLRNTAKNRIAELIVNDDLLGFFHVSVLRKAKTNKLDYYWPANREMVERYGRNMEGGDANFFKPEPNTETKAASTRWVDETITVFDSKLYMPTPVLVALYEYAKAESDDKVVPDKLINAMPYIAERFEYIEREDPARQDVEYELWLLFIVLLIWAFGYEVADKLIKDIISGRVPPQVQSYVRAS